MSEEQQGLWRTWLGRRRDRLQTRPPPWRCACIRSPPSTGRFHLLSLIRNVNSLWLWHQHAAQLTLHSLAPPFPHSLTLRGEQSEESALCCTAVALGKNRTAHPSGPAITLCFKKKRKKGGVIESETFKFASNLHALIQ